METPKTVDDFLLNKIVRKIVDMLNDKAPKGNAMLQKEVERNLNVQSYIANGAAKLFVVKVSTSANPNTFMTVCVDYYQVPDTGKEFFIQLFADDPMATGDAGKMQIYLNEQGHPVFKTFGDTYITGVTSYM